ncbi:hypothetical protein ACP26L_17690 [Paenibacillus sp. S-38]|uniref:hypothetical protein n=1 Tax=Paenibacillus sp. S-38 TaxID=3416710 RepID=UPI003CE75DB0
MGEITENKTLQHGNTLTSDYINDNYDLIAHLLLQAITKKNDMRNSFSNNSLNKGE